MPSLSQQIIDFFSTLLKAIQVQLAPRAFRGLKAIQALPALKAFRGPLVHKVLRVILALLALRVLQATPALLARPDHGALATYSLTIL
jgi:hypothetical protein